MDGDATKQCNSAKGGDNVVMGSSAENREAEDFDTANQAMALRQGSLTESQIVLRRVFALAVGSLHGDDPRSKRNAENSMNDHLFMSLLDDMRERLDELEDTLARQERLLEEKYGADFIDGMAETFLTEEERAALETDEEKLEALSARFLNPDGSTKDEYADCEEARYIRDWQEAENLRPVVNQYEGRTTLSAAEQIEVYSAAENTSLAGNKNMVALSSNEEFKASVDRALEDDRSDLNRTTSDVTVTFGR